MVFDMKSEDLMQTMQMVQTLELSITSRLRVGSAFAKAQGENSEVSEIRFTPALTQIKLYGKQYTFYVKNRKAGFCIK